MLLVRDNPAQVQTREDVPLLQSAQLGASR
jgi:hypothetical protein